MQIFSSVLMPANSVLKIFPGAPMNASAIPTTASSVTRISSSAQVASVPANASRATQTLPVVTGTASVVMSISSSAPLVRLHTMTNTILRIRSLLCSSVLDELV